MIMTDDQKAKCHGIIHIASAAAAGVGAGLAQVPLSDNVIITPIQIGMIVSLGAVFDIKLDKSTATAILGTIVTSNIGRFVSQMLGGWIPGVGNTLNATTAAAITETAGWAAVNYFENLSTEEIKKYDSAKEEGRQEVRAEFVLKLKKMNKQFEEVCEVLKQYEELDNFIMGAFSIGIAAANIDGVICEDESATMELLICGLSYSYLPDRIYGKISMLYYEKPTLNDAMKIIEKVDKVHWSVFDKVVDVMLSIDDFGKEQKAAFKAAWLEKYSIAMEA